MTNEGKFFEIFATIFSQLQTMCYGGLLNSVKPTPTPRYTRASNTTAKVEYRTVTVKELREVQSALPNVHWKKCSCNAYYAISDCGALAVNAKCAECKRYLSR